MRGRFLPLMVLVALALGAGGSGLRADTLADLRAETEALGAEIARLRAELVRGDGAAERPVEGDTLERIDRIEAALARLTAQTEELEFRIRRVVSDATNRLGDIEFRLVELEGGDVSELGRTPPLGGLDLSLPDGIAAAPSPEPAPGDDGPLMAADERRAFAAAAAFLQDDRPDDAAAALAEFIDAYPGGPMTAEAQLLLGVAHSARGAYGDAARAYLDLFTADPQGPRAPAALLALGEALSDLGETSEACVMFDELSIRFPDTEEAARGRAFFARLNCG
ncbi:MAG: tetratricopeptide repeat protein [Rhodobacteraceae bacterium]|nr:tetratricopeptide repeat protein [Paracoccaceae bacterium]